jgi:hypothetical protein
MGTEDLGPLRGHLGRALSPASVHTLPLGDGDAGGLAFPAILVLDLRQPEQDTSAHLPDCLIEVELLGDDHHPHPALAPVGEEIHPLAQPPREPIQLPHHDGLNDSRKNGLLQPLEGRPPQGRAAFCILEPLDR